VHIATRQVLRFFQYEHLKEGPGKIMARLYADVADQVANNLPEDPETTVALRKLLESKDAAVRAALQIKVSDDD
jgi:hypothetical protein